MEVETYLAFELLNSPPPKGRSSKPEPKNRLHTVGHKVLDQRMRGVGKITGDLTKFLRKNLAIRGFAETGGKAVEIGLTSAH